MVLQLTIFLAIILPLAFATANNGEDHEVHKLPGLEETPTFKHYAGQLNVNKLDMFYWYAESKQTPMEDPFVLWLNGGPGCSSMGGFFTENGPFVVQRDLSVVQNAYSWNWKANVVWLESPVGVGFSGKQQSKAFYNDEITTNNVHAFLKSFIAKYPSLKGRRFYVTGESYAGIYVPRLVDKLLKEPIEGLNLKGFAIGNPFTDTDIDGNAYFDYYYSHAMISLENYRKVRSTCSNEIGKCMYQAVNCTSACQNALNEGMIEADDSELNPYYIYGDKCLLKNNQGSMLRYTKKKLGHILRRGNIGVCADELTQEYLNKQIVQNAIHINGRHVRWTDCNDFISENYFRTPSALPYYKNILHKGLRALIYSGDADSVVNFIGTQRWISDGLKLTVAKKWRAWFGPDKQLAGYVQEYNGLAFLTVKGAGHMVPTVRPLHGLKMISCFLYEKECESFKYPRDTFEDQAGEEDPILQKSLSSRWNISMFTFVFISLVLSFVSFRFIKNRRTMRLEYTPLMDKSES